MRLILVRFLFAFLTFAIGVAASQLWLIIRQPATEIPSEPLPNICFTPISPASPIRLIDFDNLKYPSKPVYGVPGTFTLRDGEWSSPDNKETLSLVHLDYGDITGDGEEDALAVLHLSIRGSAIPYFVYLYTLKNGKLKLLWSFATGDRADGGLRQVRSDAGELIIELYGRGKSIGKNLYAPDGMTGGACCPTHFTRVRYEWRGNGFKSKEEEILPNPSGAAPFIMTRSEQW